MICEVRDTMRDDSPSSRLIGNVIISGVHLEKKLFQKTRKLSNFYVYIVVFDYIYRNYNIYRK